MLRYFLDERARQAKPRGQADRIKVSDVNPGRRGRREDDKGMCVRLKIRIALVSQEVTRFCMRIFLGRLPARILFRRRQGRLLIR
jgi:hypothetical protein